MSDHQTIVKKYFRQTKYFVFTSQALKLICLFLIVAAAIFYSLMSDFFKIKRIICQFNQTECLSKIGNKFTFLLNKNILLLNLSQETEKLKKENPYWQNLKITKKLPHQLLVEIQSFQPKAVVKENKEEKKEFYLVDNQGNFLGKKETNPGLPLILVNSSLASSVLGEPIAAPNLTKALELIALLENYRFGFEALESEEEKIIAQLVNFLVIFSPRHDLQKQVASLQLIINESKIKKREFRQIDLRFEKPVIIY